jgi:hypothetical protein
VTQEGTASNRELLRMTDSWTTLWDRRFEKHETIKACKGPLKCRIASFYHPCHRAKSRENFDCSKSSTDAGLQVSQAENLLGEFRRPQARGPTSQPQAEQPADFVESSAYLLFCSPMLAYSSGAARPCRFTMLQGAMAMTRRGLPEPPTIFSGAATTILPVGGS